MIREVTVFETDDGSRFASRAQALAYEQGADEIARVMAG